MTTYVLGAGASAHAGYPLAGELGNKLYDWISRTKPPPPFNRGYVELLYETYGDIADLEGILTELEDPPPNSRASRLCESHRKYIRLSVLVFIPTFFSHPRHVHSQPNGQLYDRFARERIHAGDVVITLNYDTACELALKKAGLWEISDGYGFSMGIDGLARSRVKVLKLHGSIDWWEPHFFTQWYRPLIL